MTDKDLVTSADLTPPPNSTIIQPDAFAKIRVRWKEWILLMLGGGVVKVELTESHLDAAIDDAIQIFAQWASWEKVGFFIAQQNRSEYNLAEMFPGYIEARNVIYSPSQAESLLQGFFTDFNFGDRQFFWYHSSYATMADYTILNMYNEMYLRTIGNEGQWSTIGTKLVLSPRPSKATKVAVIYSSYPVEEQDIRRDEWVRYYALAQCKIMLGEIRRKYSSLPGPQGDLSLNGDALVSEGREDIDKLRERLNEFVIPPMFTTG